MIGTLSAKAAGGGSAEVGSGVGVFAKKSVRIDLFRGAGYIRSVGDESQGRAL